MNSDMYRTDLKSATHQTEKNPVKFKDDYESTQSDINSAPQTLLGLWRHNVSVSIRFLLRSDVSLY